MTSEREAAGWPGARPTPTAWRTIRRVAAAVERDFGRIDILVNNAGVASGTSVEALPEEVWDDNVDTNLKGVMLMSQAVLAMKRAPGPHISASSFARSSLVGGAAYAAARRASKR